ncbi:DegV family protein [Nocardioides insulae]|uniref:DegV family protein n=1 Tax=Nocardioides insulae TaxID=394734 RepID=UPI0004068EC8|nr:DegV family protein [Nocardioides insulae]
MGHIAVVTDSAAMLPPEVAQKHHIAILPLQVVIDGESFDDGTAEASPGAVVAAMRARRPVSTSRPAPAVIGEFYQGLVEEGAERIVSVHLSAELSGTVESAQLAARGAAVPVHVLDMRGVGPCQGYAAVAAAVALADGGTPEESVRAALARADATTSFFYVDTLEHLRRGGRIGAAAALVGSALAVKPLLAVDGGLVVPKERVRTSARALARLEDLAAEAAGAGQIELTVAHMAAPERARSLGDHLAERLAGGLAGEAIYVAEIGAALGAHVGPGMLGVVVAPAL